MGNQRMCYFLMETSHDQNGNWVPCIAVEGERGYYPTDFNYGQDRELAQRCVDELNNRLGLTPHEAMLIQLSSMCARETNP